MNWYKSSLLGKNEICQCVFTSLKNLGVRIKCQFCTDENYQIPKASSCDAVMED